MTYTQSVFKNFLLHMLMSCAERNEYVIISRIVLGVFYAYKYWKVLTCIPLHRCSLIWMMRFVFVRIITYQICTKSRSASFRKIEVTAHQYWSQSIINVTEVLYAVTLLITKHNSCTRQRVWYSSRNLTKKSFSHCVV